MRISGPRFGVGGLVDRIVGTFGAGNVCIEVQRHLLREEEADNQALVDLASAFHVPVVATNGVRYATTGGRIENCSQGISELFSIVRDYSGATSTATGLTIANCTIGIKSKENCVGHFDYLQVEGCATGIETLPAPDRSGR